MSGHVSDFVLEQLVDGELDERSYRDVLAALADEPDGWRRCALAFLESQALQRDLVREDLVCPPCAPVSVQHAKQAPPRILHLLFAIAASFLAAFLAAHEFQKWRDARNVNDRLVGGSTNPGSLVSSGSSMPRVDGLAESNYRSGSGPVGSVQLVVNGSDGQAVQSIDVPVYSLDPVTSQLLVDDQPSLPPQISEALQRLGSEVRRSQYWAPVNLQDGRQIVIPVDQYEITPVSRPY